MFLWPGKTRMDDDFSSSVEWLTDRPLHARECIKRGCPVKLPCTPSSSRFQKTTSRSVVTQSRIGDIRVSALGSGCATLELSQAQLTFLGHFRMASPLQNILRKRPAGAEETGERQTSPCGCDRAALDQGPSCLGAVLGWQQEKANKHPTSTAAG